MANKKNHNRSYHGKRRPTQDEIDAMLDFFGIDAEQLAPKPKITITQTVIEFE